MSFFLDPAKSADDNFFDLIKSENPKATHLKGRVVMGVPSTDQVGLTTVQLTPIAGQGYFETEEIQYHRLPPVPAAGTQNLNKIQLSNELPQATLKELIVAHYKLISSDIVIRGLNSDTIILPEIGAVFTPDAGFRITAKSASLIYLDTGAPYESSFTVVDPSLLIDYRFEDDTKGTTVRNLAGAINGTRQSTAALPRAGAIGNAWRLSAGGTVDTGVKLPSGAVSVSMMINLQNKVGRQIFYSDHTANALSGRLAIGIGGNQMFIRVCDGTTEFVVSAGFINQIAALTMVHVGASLSADGGTLNIYRGGELIRTIATGLTIPNTPGNSNLIIGNTATGIDSVVALNAIVDNFKLFNRELSETEWRQLGKPLPKLDSRWSQTKRGVSTSLSQNDRQAIVWEGNSVQGRVPAKSGKVMFEYTDTGNGAVLVGVGVTGAAMNTPPGGGGGNSYGYNAFDGNKYYAGVATAYGASFGVLSVIGVCVDFVANTLTFYKDGVSQGVAYNIAPGTEFYPQVGSASGGATQYGGLLNLGEDGFAYPIAGYTRWDVGADLQLKIESLTLPFKDDGTKSFSELKEMVASTFRVSTSSIQLGDINGEFVRPTDGLATFEVSVPIVSLDPKIHFNGVASSTVKFRFPSVTIPDISKHFASTSGWATYLDYGWYNDDLALNAPVDLIGLPAVFNTQLTRIEGEFSQDPNDPAASTGQNQLLLTYAGGETEWFGTFDGSISLTQPGTGLQVRPGNNVNYEEQNAARILVNHSVTQQATLFQMRSGRDQNYAGSRRGCAWLRFTLMTL